MTPKENTHQTKAGSEVSGLLFLVKPLVLGNARRVGFYKDWVFPVLFHPFNEGPKVRINDKMVKWSAKRNNRGRVSAT